ncbi:hypothetical protein LTS15_008347 [Exophiala xenobiotica]|nr:hypothetical protein LTS15_008347 [Exophiala xenobiotica]
MAVVEERSRKRRKVEDGTPSHDSSFTSAAQLRNLLQLSQKAPSEIKTAIDRFSHFLSGISEEQQWEAKQRQLNILKTYCDEQFSSSHDQVDFPDLLTVWTDASQSNDDSVLTAVPAALTQFFRAVSGNLEFREFGLSLCHSLLKRDQLRLFDRGLSSPRTKDHLITCCLQLLTEVVSFDAGALASNVFGRRDLLYRRLDGILSQAQHRGDEQRATTAHAAALEFLVANLKYLDTASKSELISQGKTLHVAIRSLPNQRPNVIIETLLSLEKRVLGDTNLSKQSKIRCFNSGNLSALAKVYDVAQEESEHDEDNNSRQAVRDALHRLLLQVCANTKGVLLPQTGWYPAGFSPEVLQVDDEMIDLGLDSPYYSDDYHDKVPVKNNTIATFIQTLHPEKDVLQSNLITSIFAAAPELVADYFTKKRKFLAPPSDDPIWRGQFAFLFSVVQIPVPASCGWHEGSPPDMPPPLSVVIESILPRPLDRATITKCLHMKEDIMTISAARLLTVALEKLDSVLRMFELEQTKSRLWAQACTRLIKLFLERIPQLQDTITALQSLAAKGQERVRTAVLECIAAYHRVLPSLAAGSKFDIGPTLIQILKRLGGSDALDDDEEREAFEEQLPHLLQIADVSPTTKWFHRPTAGTLSLMAELLKYCVPRPEDMFTKQAMPVVKALLCSKGILNSTHTRSLEALLASLTSTKKWQPEDPTYQFLDNCMIRTMQRPVKYLDQIEQEQQTASDARPLSLLACCIAEQWAFVVKNKDENEKGAKKNIAEWIARLFSALDAAGENYRVMTALKQSMMEQKQNSGHEHDEKSKAMLEKAFEKQRKKPTTLPEPEGLQADTAGTAEKLSSTNPPALLSASEEQQQPTVDLDLDLDLDEIFPPPPRIPSSLSGLDRWKDPDFETEIQSGRLSNLLRCLISPDQEIRLQAFHTLQTVIHAVEQSTYPEKIQLYLLLGEASETVRQCSLTTTISSSSSSPQQPPPPPSIIAELAVHMLPVVADPSSPYYRKTNEFLLATPSWSVSRILPYWLNHIFLSEPEADDTDLLAGLGGGGGSGGNGNPNANVNANAQALEIERLLDLLSNSLRTATDLDLFRRGHVFTRLFSYFLAPVCSKVARKKILGVVHRATVAAGSAGVGVGVNGVNGVGASGSGSSETLITRAGVREWLDVAAAEVRDHSGHGMSTAGKVDPEIRRLAEAVRKEVEENADKEAVRRWEMDRPIFRTGTAGDLKEHGSLERAGEGGVREQGNADGDAEMEE